MLWHLYPQEEATAKILGMWFSSRFSSRMTIRSPEVSSLLHTLSETLSENKVNYTIVSSDSIIRLSEILHNKYSHNKYWERQRLDPVQGPVWTRPRSSSSRKKPGLRNTDATLLFETPPSSFSYLHLKIGAWETLICEWKHYKQKYAIREKNKKHWHPS